MLTREFIASPAFDALLESVPAHVRWTRERIRRSLDDTLSRRPAGQTVWIFGYGSLIWNPIVDFAERRMARLEGWERSFGHRITSSRASAEHEGRMLGLVPGKSTSGAAFRLPEATLEHELTLLWMREMLGGAYLPQWLPVRLDDGTLHPAIVFVSDRNHLHWDEDASVAKIAPLIARASGPFGTNAAYVMSLEGALAAMGSSDAYVSALSCALTAHSP